MKVMNPTRTTVEFSERAALKTVLLVQSQETEIAWHGIGRRIPGGYRIDDIFLYPQTVTGVTVEMDEEDYARWQMSLSDAVFESICMQGHSHVQMDVFPSGTDIGHQKEIMSQLQNEDFYVFMITNKRADAWVTVFDRKLGLQFETEDIDLVVDDESGIFNILDDVKTMVKRGNIAYGSYKTEGILQPG